jgi:hypothetical protein
MLNLAWKHVAVCAILAAVPAQYLSADDKAKPVSAPDEVPFVEGAPPPAAQPGDAWCLITVPATYKTVTEQVQIRPATFYMETVPAKYETKPEQIMISPETKHAVVVPAKYKTEAVKQLVKEESTTYEIVPAAWEWKEETVMIKPEGKETVVTPPVYKTVSEQIMVEPAKTYWKKVPCDDKSATKNEVTGDCYCLCEQPAKFVTVTKQVLEKEGSTAEVPTVAETKVVKVHRKVKDAEVVKKTIPAEYATIERWVVDQPAKITYETIPAKFETIQKSVMVTPEAKQRVDVPAKFETVSKTLLDQPSKMVWRKYRCDCKDIVKKYKEIPGSDIESLLKSIK